MSKPLHLTLDMIRCDAYGHCAELLPEIIELDQWGYPIIKDASLPEHLNADARRAITACPRLALKLEHQPAANAAARTGHAL